MLATVQCLTTSAFVSTGCSMIVSAGANSDADTKRPNATRYTRYALASTQRKILPVRGWRTNRCSCGIMSLSFFKPGVDQRAVEALAAVVSLAPPHGRSADEHLGHSP